MKITVDGGALCNQTSDFFGNYTFTKNLLLAFSKYSLSNIYLVYTFCDVNHIKGIKRNIKIKVLKPSFSWMSLRVPFEELKQRSNCFLALNQAVPRLTRAKIFSFSHGLSFLFYPNFYGKDAYSLKSQLTEMVNRSDTVIVSSRRVKDELTKLYPSVKACTVIPFGIPIDMLDFHAEKRKRFFLFVGMDHPVKNIRFILNAFKRFKKKPKYRGYKLILVSNFKYKYALPPDVDIVSNITRAGLLKLYQTATAYLSASYYESFNFPVLEALSQNCPVIAKSQAVIPEMTKFVSIADSNEGFDELMQRATTGKLMKKTRNSVLKAFSWEAYVEKLHGLYREFL